MSHYIFTVKVTGLLGSSLELVLKSALCISEVSTLAPDLSDEECFPNLKRKRTT